MSARPTALSGRGPVTRPLAEQAEAWPRQGGRAWGVADRAFPEKLVACG